MGSSSTRYMIARFPNAGIGDHLSCLVGSWWYAKKTDRTLIIDWRGSRFNPNTSEDCFFKFFESITSIGGVPVLVDSALCDVVDSNSDYFYTKWTSENLCASKHIKHTKNEIHEISSLILTGKDRSERFVIANQHLPLPDDVGQAYQALASIRFRTEFSAIADEFLAIHKQENQRVIGIHIRHGNGENIGSRVEHWLDPINLLRQVRINSKHDIHRSGIHGAYNDNMPPSLTASLDKTAAERHMYKQIRASVDRFRNQHQDGVLPILFTDAEHVAQRIRQYIPDIVHYRKSNLPQGAGPLHQICEDPTSTTTSIGNQQIIDDMFVELALLQRCQSLVCMPSQFTAFRRLTLATNDKVTITPPLVNKLTVKIANRLFPKKSR